LATGNHNASISAIGSEKASIDNLSAAELEMNQEIPIDDPT